MPQIRLEPLGINLNVSKSEKLLLALKRAKVEMDTVCGGQGTCGTCAIQVLAGQLALSPIESQELTTIKNTRKDSEQYRLACQTYALEDGVVLCPNNKATKKLIQIFERLKDRRAPRHIFHPTTGELLVPQDGIITQAILEELLSH